jgi:hypothetical protein
MYQGTPDELEEQLPKFKGILDKWEKKRRGEYRYDIVIKKTILYITIIRTVVGTGNKEKDLKIKELEEDVKKLKKDKDDEEPVSEP